jgi:thiosulfate reductase cytochrome b subunit
MNATKIYFHPVVVRITHWVNFFALLIMVTSGLKIYNASPIFGDVTLPTFFTFGGLAYARQYHFFAMWIFFINGGIWLLFNLISRRARKTTLFGKEDIKGVLPMIKYYLRLRKEHPFFTKYNALQKLAYTSVILIGLGIILTGVSIYWPVQFGLIRAMFGGYDSARVFHFIFMAAFVMFFLGHLLMVTIAGWSNLLSIFTGYGKSGPQEEVTTHSAL